jgi:transcriptional regulator with XRE-family HTH domain
MPCDTASPPPLPVRRALRDVGGHVQAWRKLRGLTQNQLADRAGIDRKTLMRVEDGDGGWPSRSYFASCTVSASWTVPTAVDPYETDVGRLRADDQLPRRVRPRDLRRDDG